MSPVTTCRGGNCQERKDKTGINGGVSSESLTPHKCGKGCGRRLYNDALANDFTAEMSNIINIVGC